MFYVHLIKSYLRASHTAKKELSAIAKHLITDDDMLCALIKESNSADTFKTILQKNIQRKK